MCQLYGGFLPWEERLSLAYIGYLSARQRHRRYRGRRDFWTDAYLCIREEFEAVRRQHNQRLRLESGLSLNQGPDGGAHSWLNLRQESFLQQLEFIDLLSPLEGEARQAALLLAQGYRREEAAAQLGLTLGQMERLCCQSGPVWPTGGARLERKRDIRGPHPVFRVKEGRFIPPTRKILQTDSSRSPVFHRDPLK